MDKSVKNTSLLSRKPEHKEKEAPANDLILLKNRIQQLEDKIQESENRYSVLFDSSPDPIIIHSQGKIVQANQAAIAFANVDDHSLLIGRSVLELLHPDYQELASGKILSVIHKLYM